MDVALRQDAASALRICLVSPGLKWNPRRAAESASAPELFQGRGGCRPYMTLAAGYSSSPTHWARVVFAKYCLDSDWYCWGNEERTPVVEQAIPTLQRSFSSSHNIFGAAGACFWPHCEPPRWLVGLLLAIWAEFALLDSLLLLFSFLFFSPHSFLISLKALLQSSKSFPTSMSLRSQTPLLSRWGFFIYIFK